MLLYALIFVTLLAGSVIKGVMGLGLPLVAVPILSLLVGVPHALSVVVIPMLATNAWQLFQFRRERRAVPFLSAFLALGGLGTAAGTFLLATSSPRTLDLMLAAAVAAYLFLRLSRPEFGLSMRTGQRIAPAAGLGAGLLQGATGISGPIGSTFFHALNLERGAFMFSSAAMFLLFSAVQATLLASAGIANGETLMQGLFALVPAAIGIAIGNRLARHVSRQLFDRLVLTLLVATAVPLAWRGLFA